MGVLAEYGLADRAVPACWTAAVRADPAALAAGGRGPMTAPVTVAAATITGTHTQRPRWTGITGRFELSMPTTPSG
jgi:hypothetical protein